VYPPRPMVDTSLLSDTVASVLPTVVELRRAIHRHPELSNEEFRTTDLVASTLRRHGIEPRLRTPRPGLVVDLGTQGPRHAFRVDLDALPITEPPGLDFASEVPGVMHACGHDAHTAIGVGVALALSRLEIPGRARIIFQPAEETFPGGAYEMLREGVLDGVESIFAFHVDPGLDPGRVGLLSGPITSSADRFHITLEGPGGHTARPHKTVDLIGAAGLVVTHLPALLSRMVDARLPTTLVFGRIEGGSADNVIPTTVELSGTVRTADRDLWDELAGIVERLVADLVAPVGAKAIVHYIRGIPPVVNDDRVVRRLSESFSTVLGPDAVTGTATSMGAEDFSRYLEVVPGALIRLGARPGDRSVDLHSAAFAIDERALEVGVLAATAGLCDLMGDGPPVTPPSPTA